MDVVLCKTSELAEGAMRRFEIMGYDVLAIRLGGRFYGIDSWCTYRYADLAEGSIDTDQGILVCKDCSGSWDIASGQPKAPPASFPLTVYEMTTAGDDLVLTFTY
jgi:3-phenylpropionate/trans-cinnamate dioxygenase ferredoxin subunit